MRHAMQKAKDIMVPGQDITNIHAVNSELRLRSSDYDKTSVINQVINQVSLGCVNLSTVL